VLDVNAQYINISMSINLLLWLWHGYGYGASRQDSVCAQVSMLFGEIEN
jgi:hypothetical protein